MPKEKTKRKVQRAPNGGNSQGGFLHCFPRFRAGPLQTTTTTGTVTSFPLPREKIRSCVPV